MAFLNPVTTLGQNPLPQQTWLCAKAQSRAECEARRLWGGIAWAALRGMTFPWDHTCESGGRDLNVDE